MDIVELLKKRKRDALMKVWPALYELCADYDPEKAKEYYKPDNPIRLKNEELINKLLSE